MPNHNKPSVGVVVEEDEQQSKLVTKFMFTPQIYTTMLQHCIGQKPLEACGLLSGHDNTIATNIWPMTNMLFSPNSFQMDEHQVDQVFMQIEQKGEKLVGIYHSHPTSIAYPSPSDVIYANYPETVYIIVSLLGISPDVGCFRIQNKQVTPVMHSIQT